MQLKKYKVWAKFAQTLCNFKKSSRGGGIGGGICVKMMEEKNRKEDAGLKIKIFNRGFCVCALPATNPSCAKSSAEKRKK